MRTYDDLPLMASPFGEKLYDKGRQLVEVHGILPEQLVWDVDEVWWDWLMSFSSMAKRLPRLLRHEDVTHLEFFQLKPGIFELMWGMHDAAADRGLDPWPRLWTNGYAWRLWRTSREIPGLHALLGFGSRGQVADLGEFGRCPRIFTRTDYVEVAAILLDPARRRAALASMPERAQVVVLDQLERDPFDSSFKFPELAPLIGKDGFAKAAYLVDDHGRNIKRFIAPGRRGVRVISPSPRLFRGKLPNTVWHDARKALPGLGNAVAWEIAEALVALSAEPAPASRSVSSSTILDEVHDYRPYRFTVLIPDRRIREEWIRPMRQLRQQFAR